MARETLIADTAHALSMQVEAYKVQGWRCTGAEMVVTAQSVDGGEQFLITRYRPSPKQYQLVKFPSWQHFKGTRWIFMQDMVKPTRAAEQPAQLTFDLEWL